MKRYPKHSAGYTLVEMMIAAAVTAILGMGILTYASMALRMISRNLAVNHSHDAARASLERMLSDLRQSAGQFTLMNVNAAGTTYSDVTPSFSSTSDTDNYFVNYYINDNRANGVRYYRPAGTGPYQLTGDGVNDNGTISATSTSLEFDFRGSGYIPGVGDVVQLPLIYSGEYTVVSPAPTLVAGTRYKVNLSQSTGYTLYTGTVTTNTGITYNSSNPANTAGYFYQRVGYSVLNNQLRYHPNLTDPTGSYPATWAATDTPVTIRYNVVSIAPFALLASATNSSTTGSYNLRVSLVSYDMNYSSHPFQNGSTTILDIINPRTITDQETTLSTNTR